LSSPSMHPRWVLWLRWVVACALGASVGALAVVGGLDLWMHAFMYALVVVGMVFAVVLAALQWLVIRGRLRRPERWWAWLLATVVGWGAGLGGGMLAGADWARTLGPLLGEVWADRAGSLAFVLTPGALVGTLQWIVLTGRTGAMARVPRAAVWVLANAMAWPLAFVWLVTQSWFEAGPWVWLASGAASGALAGGITGLALVWMLPALVPEASLETNWEERSTHR